MLNVNNTASFFYSLDQLSQLGLSRPKIQEYIQKGFLPMKEIKLNGRYKIYSSYLDKNKIKLAIKKQKKINYANCGRLKNSSK